jgi:Fe-S cluster assembly iron-binding protein IscA
MVIITDPAKRALKALVESRNLEEGRFIRLAAQPVWTGEGDFGLVIDNENEDDQAFHVDGLKVLIVDKQMAEGIGSAVLDYKESGAGGRFTVDIYSPQTASQGGTG